MFRRRQHRIALLLALVDLGAVFVAFWLAYYSRVLLNTYQPFNLVERYFEIPLPVRLLLLVASLVAYLAAGAFLRLYQELPAITAASVSEILRRTVLQVVLGTSAITLFQYSLRLDLSRLFVGFLGLYSLALLLLIRLRTPRVVAVLQREFGPTHNVLIIGYNERAKRLAQILEAASDQQIRVLGFVDPGPGDSSAGDPGLVQGGATEPVATANPHPVWSLDRVEDLLRREIIDEAILVVDTERFPQLEGLFLMLDEEGVRTRVPVDFFPRIHSRVYLDEFQNIPLLTFAAAPDDLLQLAIKRILDILIAATGLIVLSPFMLVVAVLIKLTSEGPVIFKQVRCGLNGRPFVLYKFRTMVKDAEALKPKLAHLNRKRTAFKIPDDPRLTPIGKYLRRFSIDEWPQLWNVLKGDMSIVGPRPAVPEEVEQYDRWQRRRLRMRPGLTCLWAIAGRDTLDFETWMKLDLEYIDTWSLWLDLKIIWQTIPLVLTGKGAY